MNVKSAILLAGLLGIAQLGWSKAAYYGKEWMIGNSDAIAIVEVTSIKEVEVKGKYWTYRQAAEAKVERVLKGSLEKKVVLHGKETFICAQVHYSPGRQLVFLSKEGGLLTGVNWNLGVRAITKDEKMEWFASEKAIHESKTFAVEDVVREIEAYVAAQERKSVNSR